MKKIVILTSIALSGTLCFGQVGIGNPSPDPASILDLTNSNNLGLILPTYSGVLPTAPPKGTVYYSSGSDVLFYKESGGGYNGISAWKYKYDGLNTEDTYYIGTGNVGIGLNNPQKKLHIKDNGAMLALEGNAGGQAYMEFYPDSYAGGRKAWFGYGADGTSALTLTNDFTDGSVNINANGIGTINLNKTTNINGNVNASGKVQEDGFDLVPAGTIVMWSGSSVPSGWRICDGTSGTPNLVGKFIKGGNTGSVGSTGGSNTKTLAIANLPAHSHTSGSLTTSSAGNHSHTSGVGAANGVSGGVYRPVKADGVAGSFTTNSTGAHTHTISGYTGSIGTATPFNIEPEYYTLIYIIKL